MVDNRRHIGYTNSCPVHEGGYGGIAQLARALGSYPSCPRFKSRCRYHAAHAAPHGALVKRLRHRPFTAVTRVRFPYASPTSPIWRHSSAGRALASHARGHRFEFCCLHHSNIIRTCPPLGAGSDLLFISKTNKVEEPLPGKERGSHAHHRLTGAQQQAVRR